MSGCLICKFFTDSQSQPSKYDVLTWIRRTQCWHTKFLGNTLEPEMLSHLEKFMRLVFSSIFTTNIDWTKQLHQTDKTILPGQRQESWQHLEDISLPHCEPGPCEIWSFHLSVGSCSGHICHCSDQTQPLAHWYNGTQNSAWKWIKMIFKVHHKQIAFK